VEGDAAAKKVQRSNLREGLGGEGSHFLQISPKSTGGESPQGRTLRTGPESPKGEGGANRKAGKDFGCALKMDTMSFRNRGGRYGFVESCKLKKRTRLRTSKRSSEGVLSLLLVGVRGSRSARAHAHVVLNRGRFYTLS